MLAFGAASTSDRGSRGALRRRRSRSSQDGYCDETSAFDPAILGLVVVAAVVVAVAVAVGVLVADLGSLLGRLAALWLRM